MTFTQQQVDDYERRRKLKKFGAPLPPEVGTTDELKLHLDIIAWCNKQYPRIKYIHARTDRKSTIQEGAPDFVLFLPGGKFMCIECKSKTGKLSIEQQAWWMEMNRLGHVTYVVRGLGEFLGLVEPILRAAPLGNPMLQEPE